MYVPCKLFLSKWNTNNRSAPVPCTKKAADGADGAVEESLIYLDSNDLGVNFCVYFIVGNSWAIGLPPKWIVVMPTSSPKKGSQKRPKSFMATQGFPALFRLIVLMEVRIISGYSLFCNRQQESFLGFVLLVGNPGERGLLSRWFFATPDNFLMGCIRKLLQPNCS